MKPPKEYKDIIITLNLWLFGKLKVFADENGMSIRAAIRFIINQYFKDKPY